MAIKIKRIEGSGNPEFFQKFAHDSYLRRNTCNHRIESIAALHETAPPWQTLQEFFAKRYRGIYRLINVPKTDAFLTRLGQADAIKEDVLMRIKES